MADVNSLLSRIDAEFLASEKQIKEFQTQQVREYHGRQERLELFSQACHQLRETWRPRLEALAQKFGDKVKLTRGDVSVQFAAGGHFAAVLGFDRLRCPQAGARLQPSYPADPDEV